MGSLDYGIANITPRYTGAETARRTNQLIPVNVTTEVTYDKEPARDSDQLFSSGSRLTIPQSGLWLTQALAEWQTSTQFNGFRSVAIQQALGRTLARGLLNSERKGAGATLPPLSHSILSLDPLIAGDQLFMEVREAGDSALDQNLIGADSYTPRLVAHRFTQPDRYIGAYLYGTANQSIPDVTWTELNLVLADFENGINWGMPSLPAKRNGVTIRTAGVYLAIGSMAWATAAALGLRGIGIYRTRPDGSISIPNSATTATAAGASTDVTVASLILCGAGDVITVRGFQLSGGSVNSLGVVAERKPNLRVLKLGSLEPSRYALGEAKLTFAQIYMDSDVVMAAGVRTPIPFNRVLHDTDSLYATEFRAGFARENGKFVIRRRGTYLVIANIAVTFNPVIEAIQLAIIREGRDVNDTLARTMSLLGGNTIENSLNCVRLAELFPGDEIRAEYLDNNNGRTVNAANPENLFRSSLMIVGLDDPQAQGSGRYNPSGR